MKNFLMLLMCTASVTIMHNMDCKAKKPKTQLTRLMSKYHQNKIHGHVDVSDLKAIVKEAIREYYIARAALQNAKGEDRSKLKTKMNNLDLIVDEFGGDVKKRLNILEQGLWQGEKMKMHAEGRIMKVAPSQINSALSTLGIKQ